MIMARRGSSLTAEVKRPSALDAMERETWRQFMAVTPHLQRAFFTHAFALACERAHHRAYVAVLRQGPDIVGFLPFQFAGPWQQRVGLAERIGGALSDHAGIVAKPSFDIDPPNLLRLCRLSILFMDHLSDGQAEFGLLGLDTRLGHVVDLRNGVSSYFASLKATHKKLFQDTERRQKLAHSQFGEIKYSFNTRPDWRDVSELLEHKRQQYIRTKVKDVFFDNSYIKIISNIISMHDTVCQPVLTRISAGGRILAQHLGLIHAGRLSYWFPVYDVAARKVSPGRMLLWHTIATAEQHELRWIDRGEGDSQAKRDFSTGIQHFGRANWCAVGWRPLIAGTLQRVAWRLSA